MIWNQVSKPDCVFLPNAEEVRWEMEPPVKPDAQGNDPVPMPGITEYKI